MQDPRVEGTGGGAPLLNESHRYTPTPPMANSGAFEEKRMIHFTPTDSGRKEVTLDDDWVYGLASESYGIRPLFNP